MIAVFLAPMYALVLYYLIKRTFQWFGACFNPLRSRCVTIPLSIIFIIFASTPMLSFFLPVRFGMITYAVRKICTYWLGIVIYLFMFLILTDVIVFVLKKLKLVRFNEKGSKRGFIILGVCVMLLAGGMSTYGRINASIIKEKDYTVDIAKTVDGMSELKVALIADLHLGYSIGYAMVDDMVNKINNMNVDLVVVAGDIFDNDYDNMKDPQNIAERLSDLESTYGTYACYGNHDVSEKILAGFTFKSIVAPSSSEEMDNFLKRANINLLSDQSVLIDNKFYLVGRKDYSKSGTTTGERLTETKLTEKLDKSKPVFFIDHQPRDLQEIADCGVDIDFSGHTHDGQLFPGNLLINLSWENACGMIKKDNMYSIVTSGVGVYGPNMRTFTDSEICNVTINFTGE